MTLRVAAAGAICLLFATEHVGQSANSIGGNVVAAPPPFAGLVWTFIGPQPSAAALNSSPAFGNTSGRISALAVDQSDLYGNTVYAGAAQGGVWRSTDGGQTWSALTDTQASLVVGAVAIAPSNHSVIYAATGSQEEIGLDDLYGAGILRSTDGGATWTQTCSSSGATLGSTCPFIGPFSFGFVPGGGARISSLAVNPANASQVLAAVEIFSGTDTQPGEPGIYCSNDSGATWMLLNLHPATAGSATGTIVFYASGTTAFAALGAAIGDPQNGIYVSTTANAACASQSWAPVSGSGLPAQTSWGRIVLTAPPGNANDPNNSDPSRIVLYAGIADADTASESLLGLFTSANSGASWTRTTAADSCTPRCFYDLALGADPADPTGGTLFAGGSASVGGTLVRTTDGGSTWSNVSASSDGTQLHPGQHSIAFASGPSTSRMYVANEGGIWSTTNRSVSPAAITWSNLNSALGITQFHPGISFDESHPSVVYAGAPGNDVQMFSGSKTWQRLGICSDGGSAIVDPFLPSTVYASCALGSAPAIFRSVTGGAAGSYSAGASGIAASDPLAPVPPFVADVLTQNRLYFGTNRLWQSNDGAGSWTAISGNLAGSVGNGIALSAIALNPANPAVIYTGAQDGTVSVAKNATAGAATFSNVSAGLPAQRPITKIVIEGADGSGNTAYVAFTGFSVSAPLSGPVDLQGHIFKTSNGGATWTDISCHVANCSQPAAGDLPNIPVNDVVLDPDDPSHNTIYVGTDSGVFVTGNGGTAWAQLGSGLPNVPVFALALHDPSRTLVAATHGRSAWSLTLPSLTGTPIFALSGLSASSTSGGASSAFPLTLSGRGFTANSTVLWNGSAAGLSPTVNSSTSISVNVSPSLLAQGGRVLIQVHDSTLNPSTTNALPFSIIGSGPVITSVAPNSTAAEGPNGATDLAITIIGANFAPNAAATIEGSSNGITTNSVNAAGTQINATISHSLLQFGGQFLIGATNPPPSSGSAAAVVFTVNDSTPPSNDNFANATQITTSSFTGIVDSFAATTEATDPTPSCSAGSGNPLGKTVWWKFTASAAGTVTADTIGSSYDTLLSVYTGAPGSFAQVACNNDITPGTNRASRVTFNAVAGTTYFFDVSVWDISLAPQSPDIENGGKTVLNFSGPLAGGLTATPTTATISAGGSTSFTVTALTPPFTGQVALTVSGCPPNSTCALVANSVTAGGSTMLNVSTTSRSTLIRGPNTYSPKTLPLRLRWVICLLAIAIVALGKFVRREEKSSKIARAALPAAACLLIFLSTGCFGRGTSVNTSTTNTGTPAGTYTLTITGSANTVTATTSVTLTVN